MKDIITFNLFIDDHLESYKTFFDHEWADRILTETDGTGLYDIAVDLCVNWKSAVNMHVLPWFVVQSMSNVAEGMASAIEPVPVVAVKLWASEVEKEMEGHLNRMGRKKLRELVHKSSQRAANVRESLPPLLPAEVAWKAFLDRDQAGSHEFHLAVWGSQRLCYGALYHAYECFLTRCVGRFQRNEDYRVYSAKALGKDLAAAFGKDIAEDCLEQGPVVMAREVRNTLAHNGGRANANVAAKLHGVRIEEGLLHLMPADNKDLFDMLKVRAENVAMKALAVPHIRHKP